MRKERKREGPKQEKYYWLFTREREYTKDRIAEREIEVGEKRLTVDRGG